MIPNPNKDNQSSKELPDMAYSDNSIFDHIALCMSGGGFRAAAYSLGTLKGLDNLGILENVQILSTISGGTITGAYYALRRKHGDNFDKIYQDFYSLLEADNWLSDALTIWETERKGQSQYKLINAFADVYDRQVYSHAYFREFFEESGESNDKASTIPLQTVIFGATEMYSGTAFRFQYADLPTGFTTADHVFRRSYLIGNGNVSILPEQAHKLRISDIVAASSCFPGGFEPLVLPDDFQTNDSGKLLFFSNAETQLPLERLALIDGGVYDNQGIEGLLSAERRNQQYRDSPEGKKHAAAGGSIPKPTSLYLISDVASAGMDLYKTPAPGPLAGSERSINQWGRIFNKVKWSMIILLAVAVASTIIFRLGNSFLMGVLTGILFIFSLLVLAGDQAVKVIGNKIESFAPSLVEMALSPIKKLTVNQVAYLLRIRGSIVLELLNTVFLRRVRSLNYSLLYDENTDKPSSKVVLSSIIGGILKDYKISELAERLHPVIETIKTARSMGTTLWWQNDKNRMDKIIDSAQITLYWRIVRYFEHHSQTQSQAENPFNLSPKDKMVYERAKRFLQESYGVNSPDL